MALNSYQVPDEGQGFDLTPMIDVVFLLIVFFMTVASMITADKIDLNLAVADESAIPREIKDRYTFSITPDGSFYAGPNLVDLEALETLIANLAQKTRQTRIVLRVDRRSEHQHVNKVLQICSEHGINDIIFATYETAL